jgi:hypothetical protein
MRVSIRTWATTIGVSRQAAYRAVTRCAIPVDEHGRVDPDEATGLYRARTQARAQRLRPAAAPATTTRAGRKAKHAAAAPNDAAGASTPRGNGDHYAEARARRERAEAALAEARLGEVVGRLVDAQAVRAAYGARVATVRDGFLQLPARLAADLAREADAAKVRAMLDEEIRRVLTFFAEGVQHDGHA